MSIFLAYMKKMGKSSLLASTFSQNWSKSLMRTIVHIFVLLYFRRLVHFIESYHKSWKMLKLKGKLSEFKNIQKPECRHIIVNYDIQDDI